MTISAGEETSSLLEQDDTTLEGMPPPNTPPSPRASRWRTKLSQHFLWRRCSPSTAAIVTLLLLLSVFIYRDFIMSEVFLTSDDYPVDWHCPPPLPSAPFPPSRVLIFITDDRPMPATSELPEDVSLWPYYVLTHYLNTRYAALHGYVYQRMTQRMASSRDVVWSKVHHLMHSIDWTAYDYVVAVDSDAWFSHLHVTLHDMLHCFSPDSLPATFHSSTAAVSSSSSSSASQSAAADFIFSSDYPMEARYQHDLNAGVFIMRTTPNARAILQQWWSLADLPQHSHLQTLWPAEQGVLNELLMKNESVAAHVHVLPRQVIYGHAAAYISHVTSYWPRQRGWKGRREQLIMRDIVRADVMETLK